MEHVRDHVALDRAIEPGPGPLRLWYGANYYVNSLVEVGMDGGTLAGSQPPQHQYSPLEALVRDGDGAVWLPYRTIDPEPSPGCAIPDRFNEPVGRVVRIDPASGRTKRIMGLGVVTSFATGPRGSIYVEGSTRSGRRRSTISQISRISRSGKVRRYALPSPRRAYKRLYIGPKRRAWLTFQSHERSAVVSGVAAFTLPAG